MSRRTKALFWLSLLPVILAFGAAACATIYAFYLTHVAQATYFVIFHFHVYWLRLSATSAVLLGCALISLSVDRRNVGKK